jgi:AraC family transcriptional regulator of adaptative response/methylated-DNA-[protein]-cysteine methyltransferase
MNEMAERCQAYETVAQAIRFIRQNARQQPGLEEIAAHTGLSPFHLQRTFSTWAGISPKRFLQYLTREHARSLLRQSHDVLAAAHASGLSGPGRLHDLMIACDAVTPGEVRALGAGLEITYGFGLTPFGRVIAGTTQRGLCHLQFTTGDDLAIAIGALHDEWPKARLLRDDNALAATIARLFAVGNLPEPPQVPLRLLLRGTNFQIKVWEALLKIPVGEIVSYQTLAAMIGNPHARRAVGTALAQNRIALLIPCHRVIRESGEIGQYRWGSERKNALLAFESASIRHQD